MNFKRLTLEDIQTVRPYLDLTSFRTCDYTVGGMFMWRDFYRIEYTIVDGIFYSRLQNENGEIFYNLPLGKAEITKAVQFLKNEENMQNIKLCTVPEKSAETMKSQYQNIHFREQEIFSDYLYTVDDLANFSGKKYHGQRNMIQQFLRNNENFECRKIVSSDLNDIKLFLNQSYSVSENAGAYEIEEEKKVYEVLDNFDTYSFFGYLLKAQNKIVGFSLGEIVGDTLFVHIEKADRKVKGAYQMLVNSFAKQMQNLNIKYINREEDMGDEGLKASKLSYHPTEILKKYIVEI